MKSFDPIEQERRENNRPRHKAGKTSAKKHKHLRRVRKARFVYRDRPTKEDIYDIGRI